MLKSLKIMNKRILLLLSFLISTFFGSYAYGQFIRVNGTTITEGGGSPSSCASGNFKRINTASAVGNLSANCVTLTTNSGQNGAVWVCDAINLNQPFKITFTANFGTNSAPGVGDGIAFLLQREAVPGVIGGRGGGIGYAQGDGSNCQGGTCPITPSVAVEFDTNFNASPINDIAANHIAIHTNGVQNLANTLAGPVNAIDGVDNIRDGLAHDVCVTWDPAINRMQVYFDRKLRLTYNGNIRDVFGVGASSVWFGFTSATSPVGSAQTHTVCSVEMFTGPSTDASECACVTKTWNGSSSDNWNLANNWTPTGIPTSDDCVIIPNVTNTSNVFGTNYNAFGKSLLVRTAGRLIIHPTNTLTIGDGVTVESDGIFNIENSGSLIQINNITNTGNITMRRNTLIDALDYVYWSSPVASFTSSAISPSTSTGLIWKWEPTTVTGYDSNFGNWVNGSEVMTLGRGYIVRAPTGWSATPTTYTANFVGVPNNGTITRPITRSTYTGASYTGPTSTLVTANDDNWNLLGNPYPSAISADDFLTANLTHLNGFLDLWTHGIAPSAAIADPFYQDYQLNYSPNDYLRYNRLGGTQFGFDGKIGAGQGFFVLMRDAGATTENAIFNNTMRSNIHRNDQFFRSSNGNENATALERHRIWLKMIAPNQVSTDMLVGYATGATNNLDDEFDAINRGTKLNYELYSIAENQGLSIQGRSLPFDTNDQVQLGIAISQNGIHTIAISGTDGLFETPSQKIYLEDREIGIIHDLRSSPYTFTATPGRYENRFVLRYNNGTLGDNNEFNSDSVYLITNSNLIISSNNTNIESVQIYDLLGRLLLEKKNVKNKELIISEYSRNNSTIVVFVKLINGQIIQKMGVF
jgi:hypothetical protein